MDINHLSEIRSTRLKELEAILSINEELARVKNRLELRQVLANDLTELLPFTDSTIWLWDKKLNRFSSFFDETILLETDRVGTNCLSPNYPPFCSVLEAQKPVVYALEELARTGNTSDYLTKLYEAGLTEITVMALQIGEEFTPCLFLCADPQGTFTSAVLDLLKRISVQLTAAIGTTLDQEEVLRRNEENKTLLSISQTAGSISDKQELLHFILTHLKTSLQFSDICISRYDLPNQTYSPFLYDCPLMNIHSDFSKIAAGHYPIQDNIHNVIIASDSIVIFSVTKLMEHPMVHIEFMQNSGVKELACIKLEHNGEIIGALILMAGKEHSFSIRDQFLIHQISLYLAIVVSNIIASEVIKERDQDRLFRLALSHDLATVRSKSDLLTIINFHLKKQIDYSYSSIGIVNDDNSAFQIHFIDSASFNKNHPDYHRMVNTWFTLDDGIADNVFTTGQITLFKLDELVEAGTAPVYAVMNYASGIQEMLYAPLIKQEGFIGAFVLHSNKRDGFKATDLILLKTISDEIALTVSNILANEELQRRDTEKSILLELSADMANIWDKNDWLRLINTRLRKLFPFTHSVIGITNDSVDSYKGLLLDLGSKSKVHPDYLEAVTRPNPVKDGLLDVALAADGPVVFDLDEVIKMPTAPLYIKMNYDVGSRETVMVALHSETKNKCCFILYADQKNSFTPYAVSILKNISHQLSTAIANILANEEILNREKEKSTLLSFSTDIAKVRSKSDLSVIVNQQLKNLKLMKKYVISVINEDKRTHSGFLYDPTEPYTRDPQFLAVGSRKLANADGLFDVVLRSDVPLRFDVDELLKRENVPPAASFWKKIGLTDVLGAPLKTGNKDIGVFWLMPDQINMTLLQGVSAQIAIAIANILANEKVEQQLNEINTYKKQLEVENLYLQEEIETAYNYTEIIGEGPEIQKIYQLLSQVAFANTTVLILGESGTGKELIARALHNASPRKDKLMVKVNCAALPPNLIESELFGHEKGAFTGAIDRRIGKFELANGGTLFLDEIGEMPLELQVKLLRALQEKEIERVGGKTTLKVDVRIIAATNRDLRKEVAEGRFRLDLYYRLNVFPITLPPLRERKEDIPELARYFIKKYAKNAGKKIGSITNHALDELVMYNWPGNIRELEHLIERSVLMAAGNTLENVHLPITNGRQSEISQDKHVIKTIEENERDHILATLKLTNGKIAGPTGAAHLLGINVSTLNSRIKKLGITKN